MRDTCSSESADNRFSAQLMRLEDRPTRMLRKLLMLQAAAALSVVAAGQQYLCVIREISHAVTASHFVDNIYAASNVRQRAPRIFHPAVTLNRHLWC